MELEIRCVRAIPHLHSSLTTRRAIVPDKVAETMARARPFFEHRSVDVACRRHRCALLETNDFAIGSN